MNVINFGKPGMIYNIGSGKELSNIELVNIILKKMSKPTSLLNFVKDRKGHDFRYFMGLRDMELQFNWNPKIDFNYGLDKTIKFYENYENFLEK